MNRAPAIHLYSRCIADCRDANSIRIYAFVYSNTDDYEQKWNAQLIAALEIDESTSNHQR